MTYLRTVFYYILGIITILIISVLPDYISNLGHAEVPGLFRQILSLMQTFMQPDNWIYTLPASRGSSPLLDVLWGPYLYSIRILLGALLLGFSLAFAIALLVNFLPKRLQYLIERVLDFLESIPDLVFATLMQALVIYIFKATDVLIFPIASYMEKQVFLAPVITLAILPMITMFKHLLFMIEEASTRDYVVFLRSKGISSIGILIKHVLKNMMPSVFQNVKLITWATLSSQFIIERIFNVHGITFYMFESFTPLTIAVSLILIFTPFYVFFQLIDLWLRDEQFPSTQLRIKKRSSVHREDIVTGLKRGYSHLITSIKKMPWMFFNSGKHVLRMIGTHMKNWKFAMGMTFFIIVIGYSVGYTLITDSHVDQELILYEEDGTTIRSSTPHSPPNPFLLGSDQLGFSILDKMVIGAKYTLVFGLIIAFLRVFGGLLFGVLFSFGLKSRWQRAVEKLTDSIHFLPLSLVAYIVLRPILMPVRGEFAFSFTERIIWEIVILTVLVVPLTTVLIGRDINGVLKREFILGSRVLGGDRLHIFWKHVLPHIGPRLTVLFGQQFIQTLLIFIHLGVFGFFFGGTKLPYNPGGMSDPPTSITYEWSGLIGSVARGSISSGHYWYLWPLAAFVVAIFAMQLIIQGVKEVQQVKVGVLFKLNRRSKNKRSMIGAEQPPPPAPERMFRMLK